MEVLLYILFSIFLAAGIFLGGWFLSRKLGNERLADVEQTAGRIISEAKKNAETLKKEALLEAKEEWYQVKVEFEKGAQSKRMDLQKYERRLRDKESNLDRKMDLLNQKDRELKQFRRDINQRDKNLKTKESKVGLLFEEQNMRLEKIAGLTKEQAKQELIRNLEEKARHEAAHAAMEIKEKAARDAEKEARKIITLAIQRYAAEHVAETSVSVVSLPNEEMKGRIIGREGRNIRSFETATGIDVIIDDTPEAVILSGFDPIRREVARLAMEKLIVDGRIHPGRIEEVVEKTRGEINQSIIEAGEQAAFELSLHGIHPEILKLLGRLKYRTSYGQNVLRHVTEVGSICGIMAAELGLNQTLAKRAALLHDIGKAVAHDVEGSHVEIGVQIARRYGENNLVINAIAAHHEDVECESLIAVLVKAADAVSGGRPGARRETLENYIKRLERLEEIAESLPGVDKSYAIRAGREVRIVVQPGRVNDIQAAELATTISKTIEGQLQYPGQIKVTVIREIRAIEYAK
ncbi:MAG: ribonuclease Y [Candidatus Cloacimonetes bacterium 4572_55]|nr:MAG: ribonuclease Y [Candidatus Cloacimonetes bacterium 4572_55]